jgi:hypothetical protein
MAVYREYWMIHREPSFLAVVWFFLPHPPPLPVSRQLLVSLSQSSCVSQAELTAGKGREGGGGRGAESYDSEKAWPCINHSILSGGMKPLDLFKINIWIDWSIDAWFLRDMIEDFFCPRDARNCKTIHLRTTKLVKSNKVTKNCIIGKKSNIRAKP